MTHVRTTEAATELVVVDLTALASRPHSRIAFVEVVTGSPALNMVMSDRASQRKWKIIGVGMTPPSVGPTMALTLETVEGDGQLSAGDRLTSA